MFLGRYYHTIEEHGRVSLPKKFREESHQFVITRGLDGGLFLFTQADWLTQIQDLSRRTFTKKTQRDFVRLMTNDAQEVEVDKLGRILLPEYLREFAKLDKQTVIVGSYNRIELWNPELYHAYIAEVEAQAQEIAEHLEPAQEGHS